jgi:hypothetical protein
MEVIKMMCVKDMPITYFRKLSDLMPSGIKTVLANKAT